jgi:hypothetical protein
MKHRWLRVIAELRHHAPFTLLGAVIGIICMVLLKDLSKPVTNGLFNVFHPAHVLLSALVTASLFKMRKEKTHLVTILLVGYLGSIGVATLSDCIVPFWGESLLGVSIPAHAHAHEEDELGEDSHEADAPESDSNALAAQAHDEHDHEHEADHNEEADTEVLCDHPSHKPELHLAFIEEWYIINPLALIGILLAWFIPHQRLHTKMPHALHVLISTWASSFHILTNMNTGFTPTIVIGCFVVLFIAVWLPCCISDIVFPILCVGEGKVPSCCGFHKAPPHEEKETE